MNKIKEAAPSISGQSDWPRGELPLEKLRHFGPQYLSNAELLALLLQTNSKNHSSLEISRKILLRYDNFREISGLSLPELYRIEGIGPAKAAALVAAFEIARRINSLPIQPKLKVTDPEVIFHIFEPRLMHLRREIFFALCLNSANYLTKEVKISEGILNSALVHPREVFRPAIVESAASIILVHNHPSGEVEPSIEDRNITKRLVELGRLIDIPVLDHIIIGERKYFSFREGGLIE